MIGIDIVKVERFNNISDAFMRRVFTPREREYIKNAQSAAGIFAAKEAVAKALGTGFRSFSPCDIEVIHNINGKPLIVLHNNAKKVAKRRRFLKIRIHVSITHSDTDAVAIVQI
jgi:phosphopantetheine--protein transferase-like protein